MAYRAHAIREHLIHSSAVAEAFTIKVLQPASRSDDSERFPVLYATDSDDFFGGYASIANILQFHGETPRFILVGIGYENARAAGLLRMRDFYTERIRVLFQREIEQFAASPPIGGIEDLQQITHSTGAAEFLRFIRDELMPFVDANYPTVPGENSYFGYSSGGAFGLYALFTHPDTFKRYILGSPATSHGGHHFAIDFAESFAESGRTMDAKVFMSVGELEEFKRGLRQFDLVTGYYLLAKHLTASPIPGLALTLRVFPGETHATAWTLAFTHGLKTLFGPVEQVPYWPDYLK